MPGSARGWNPAPRGPPPPPRPKYNASKREQEIMAAAVKSPNKEVANGADGEGPPAKGQHPSDDGEGALQQLQQQQQQQQLQKKKDEEAASMYHGGSMKTYMQLKNTKLQEQFEANSLQLVPHSNIFQGVSIFVNGYTQPTHAELRQIMLMHGGRFETYFYRDRVTHYVCQNLPDTKIKMLAHERHPPRIVRPQWITASLQAGRLLPVEDFQLSAVCDKPGQRKIMDFKQHDTTAIDIQQLYPQLQQQQQQQQQQHLLQRQVSAQHSSAFPSSLASSLPGGHPQGSFQQQQQQLMQGHQPQASTFLLAPPSLSLQGHDQQVALQQQQQQQQQGHQPQATTFLLTPPSCQPAPSLAHQQLANPQQALFQGQVHLQQQFQAHPQQQQQQQQHYLQNHCQPQNLYNQCQTQPQQQQYPQNQCQPQPQQQQPHSHAAPTAAGALGNVASNTMEEAQALCARLRSECDLLRGAPRSSRDDPGFMDSYFRSSRLHFIGTWKSRIEALMAEDDIWGPQPLPTQGARQPAGTLRQFLHPSTSTPTPSNTTNNNSNSSNPRAATPLPQQQLPTERAIIHLDMDCFFAAASVVDYPVLRGKPLVVCHSSSAHGTGEVSAANYEARAFGVCAGSTIGTAKRLCPPVLVVPYMFEKYTEISEQVYRILMKYTACVQALSCDEAYLDVTGLGDPEELAAAIRAEIHATTQCTASAGIGPNMLLARIATGHGKPNGQFRVASGQGLEFLADLPVTELPGVGDRLERKLKDLQISHVRQVWSTSRERLQRLLGTKTGQSLWQYAHGRDNRSVEPPKVRKSVGAEVNWGIRFDGPEDADKFLQQLATELAQRMRAAGVRGKCVSLKMKRRQEGAPTPFKCLGHGPCDNLSRSITLSSFTDAAADILREARVLYGSLNVPDGDVRGLGITMSKLDCEGAVHAAARPSMPPPSKLHAPTPTHFKPREDYTSLSDRPITSPPPNHPSPARTHVPTRTHTASPLPNDAIASGVTSPPHQMSHQPPLLGKRKAAATADTPTKATLRSKAAGAASPPERLQITLPPAPAKSAPSSALANTPTKPALSSKAADVDRPPKEPLSAPAAAPAKAARTSSAMDAPLKSAHTSTGMDAPPKPAPSDARAAAPAKTAPSSSAAVDASAASDGVPARENGDKGPESAKGGMDGADSVYAVARDNGDVRRGGARGGQGGTDRSEGRLHAAEQRSDRSGGRGRAAEGRSGAAGGKAYAGLPASADDLDPEVLQALPLQVRKEIEAAYGLVNPKQPSKPSGQPRQQPKQKRTRAQQPRASHNPSHAKLQQTTLASSFSGTTGKPAHKQPKLSHSNAASTNTASADSVAAAAAHNISAISCWVISRPKAPSGSVDARGNRMVGGAGGGGATGGGVQVRVSRQATPCRFTDGGGANGGGCMRGEGECGRLVPLPRSHSHESQAASEGGKPAVFRSDGERARQTRPRDDGLGEGGSGDDRGGKRRKTLGRCGEGGRGKDGGRQGRELQTCMEVDSPMMPDGGMEGCVEQEVVEEQVVDAQGEQQQQQQQHRGKQVQEQQQQQQQQGKLGQEQQQQQQQQQHQGKQVQEQQQQQQQQQQQGKQEQEQQQGRSEKQQQRQENADEAVHGRVDSETELVQSPCLMDQLQHLTCSQVDPLELAQLPPALQQEVMRELKPRPKRTAIPKAQSTTTSRGGASHTSAAAANFSTRAGPAGGKGEVSMGDACRAGQVAGKQQQQQQQQQGGREAQCQRGGKEAQQLKPCPYLMAQPPAAVRRDFRDFMRSACRALMASELSGAEGAGATAATASVAGHASTPGGISAQAPAGHNSTPVGTDPPPGTVAAPGTDAPTAAAPNGHTSTPRGPSAPNTCAPPHAPGTGCKVPTSSGHNAAAAATQDCAVQYDLKSAFARMEGWALAHCGNLEETGKTLGVLEGLLCGVGMPAWVMEMVQHLLWNIRAAVHARYGVHLLPL